MNDLEPKQPETQRRIWLDLLILAVLLLVNAVVLVVKGTERFEFFDMSGFLDAGYRVYIGQEPYVDFYYIAGPIHLYLHALSFLIFGFTKTAVMVHLCVVGLAATTIVYIIARKYLSRILATGLGGLTIFSFYGPVCHPWYDHNAAIWIMVGILMWEFLQDRLPLLVAVTCGILAGLSFLTKSNVGLAGGLVLLSLVASQSRPIKHVLMYVASGLLTLGVFALILKSPGNFVDQAFFAYHAGGRLVDFQRFYNSITTSFNIPIFLMGCFLAILAGRDWIRKNLAALAFFTSLIFIGAFTNWTSSLSGNLVWLSIQLLYLFILARNLDLARFGERVRWVRSAMWFVLAGVWAGCTAISMSRTQRIYAWRGNEGLIVSDYEIQTPAFKGWRCNAATGKGVDLTVAYINENIPAGDSILVLPTATFLYGLTGRDSYRKVPFLFHRGETTNGRWREECRDHILEDPPKWFIMHQQTEKYASADIIGSFILQSLDLSQFFEDNYHEVWRFGQFSVHRHNEPRQKKLDE